MGTTFKGLFSVVKHYKSAVMLNLLGLSIAFVAFLLLALQIRYEWNFDTFHKDADRIFRLSVVFPEEGASALFSRPLGDEFIKSSPHVLKGALVRNYVNNIEFSIHRGDEVYSFFEDLRTVDPEYLNIFQFQMKEGSLNCLQDPDKIVIPISLANKLFGDKSAVNQQLYIGKKNLTIGGVYYDLPSNSVVKNFIYQQISTDTDTNQWQNQNYQVYLLLDDAKKAPDILDNFKRNFHNENYDWSRGELRLTDVQNIYYETDTSFESPEKGNKSILYMMILIALLIISIAGINFMNFYNAIIPMRIKNIMMQKVLGNSTLKLRLSLLMEILGMSIIAYIISLLCISYLSNTAIANLIISNISIKANLLFFTFLLLIPVCIGFISGIYPIISLTSYAPATVLKGSFARSLNGKFIRNLLIGLQFFVSFVLFMAAFFIHMQNKYMKNETLGYDKNAVVVVKMNEGLNQNRELFENEIRQQPSVENIAFTNVLFAGDDYYSGWSGKYNDKNISYQALWVDANFLDVMGIKVTEGRDFRLEDEKLVSASFLFNETARKMYNMHAGDKITATPEGNGIIVGFMNDAKFQSFRVKTDPMAFLLLYKSHPSTYFTYAYIRLKEDMTTPEYIQKIRDIAQTVSPGEADVVPFSSVVDNLYKAEDNMSFIISLFSIVAIFISISGVFSLIMFESEYRKKEVSIRKVYGASIASIVALFNRSYLFILLLAFILATPFVFYGINYWLQNFAYKIPLYNWVFVVTFLFLSIMVSLIVTTQVWHSANENPINNLKQE